MMRWSQDVVVSNHGNIQATTMSIDITGSLAVLGSKRNLIMIDLDNPTVVQHKVGIENKYDISHIEWNPLINQSQYFLTTYSKSADIWKFDDNSGAVKLATVSGHTRAVSDANWSYSHPNLMATCSLDSYICLWDIREIKRPKLTMSTVAGVSQIKWNKINDFNLASSHDGNIRVWDVRSPSTPVNCIMAHVSNIYSIDWSPISENLLVSGSQDTNISFWDTSKKYNEGTLSYSAKYPVWRVQFNPNHRSVTSLTFKNVRETPLCLWDINEMDVSTQMFENHVDVVLDFGWRKKRNNNIWQLVTWSKDQSLRFCQPTYDFSQNSVANDLDSSKYNTFNEYFVESNLDLNSQISPEIGLHKESTSDKHIDQLEPYKTELERRSKSYSLDNELNSVKSLEFPGIQIVETSASSRFCVASVSWDSKTFKLIVKFPKGYPLYDQPKFEFTAQYADSPQMKFIEEHLSSAVEQTSLSCSNNQMLGYLQRCFQTISDTLKQQSKVKALQTKNFPIAQELIKTLKNIPYPKTCKASFCGAGYLVVFTGLSIFKMTQTGVEKTPKSLKSLVTFQNWNDSQSNQQQEYGTTPGSNTSKSLPREKKPRRYFNSRTNNQFAVAPTKVFIFDFSPYLPVSKSLAAKYKTEASFDICAINKQIAFDCKRPDLYRLWSSVNVLSHSVGVQETSHNELCVPFKNTPAGQPFVDRLFEFYSDIKDFQTMALLSSVYKNRLITSKTPCSKTSYIKSTNKTVKNLNISPIRNLKKRSFKLPVNHLRQQSNPEYPVSFNSYDSTKSLDTFSQIQFFELDNVEREESENGIKDNLLSVPHLPQKDIFYDAALISYGDYLKRINQHFKSLEIESYLSNKDLSVQDTFDVRLVSDQPDSNHDTSKPFRPICQVCQTLLKNCSFTFCLSCGHGGHLQHIQWYFQSNTECPSSVCLCNCLN